MNSVLDQTYRNFEVILVDDGSSDGSPAICDSYAQKDSRIKVIHKKNEGAGPARNDGLKLAQGEYIVFVDSDDTIEADYMEELAHHTEDLVFIDVDNIDKHGRVVGGQYMSKYSHCDKEEILRSQMTGRVSWGG